MNAHPALALLRLPGYRAYLFGATVSAFGTRMAQVALPLALLADHHGAADLGLVMGAAVVPKALLLLIGGVAGDRLNRRRLLVSTDLLMGLAQALTALVLATGAGGIWPVVGLQLLYGCASAFSGPALAGLMPELVAPARLQEANALLRTAVSTAQIIGPAAVGLAALLTGPALALAADAVSFGLSALAFTRMPALPRVAEAVAGGGRPARIWPELRAGWSAFTATSWIWIMVGSFAVYQATVLPALWVIGPPSVGRTLGAAAWATVLTARSLGSLLAGLTLLRWRPTRPIVAVCFLVLLDVPMLIALTGRLGLVGLAITGALSALGVSVADTLWESTLQREVAPDLISRISSYDLMGSVLLAPAGFALIAGAVGAVGEGTTLLAVLVLHVVIHLVLPCLGAIRRIRQAPAGAEPARAATDAPPHPETPEVVR
ncbi:MFS transporter [Kitasatospora sp. MMS16-BH015]|uniref:MFS transporter n=1 Tax=Kitasatospora sp. MMS16-BH015 TaxID=2018025 RepID=UPI000CA33F4C|nr:MFS transporter [Kitasatospora sp. MMS16-BH015]AUG80543.1 MFS transporter [Kitasatospora sp. MMS16-BH015]